MEAVQVVKYVQAILSRFKENITVDDIGIVTPYRKQVRVILDISALVSWSIDVHMENLSIQGLCIQIFEVFKVIK